VRGLPAWLMHRAYHWKALPTWSRRIRVLADWVLALLLRRDVAALDYALVPIGGTAVPPAATGNPPREGSARAALPEASRP